MTTSPRRAGAAAFHLLPPTWAAPILRRLPAAADAGGVFAQFSRHGLPALELRSGYRQFGKGRWRGNWWATRGLLELQGRVTLPPRAGGLVAELLAARTLPAPLAEFATALEHAAAEHPHLVERTGRVDPLLGREILVPLRTDEQIATWSGLARSAAREMLRELAPFGLDVPRSRMLDCGCGRGYTAFAVAAEGAAEVFGVDLDVRADAGADEMLRVRDRIAGRRRAEIAAGDLAHLDFPDAFFDLVFSSTVVEHLVELPRVFEELRRVLRPRGLAYHGIDPWFGPAGGHSLCTLDVPWGHVRLDDEEFARYVRAYRPHEAEDAIRFYLHGFQRPRLTLAQTADAARAAGFDVLAATRTPLPLRDPHRAWFSGEILRDCRRRFPRATAADLLTLTTKLILRRR